MVALFFLFPLQPGYNVCVAACRRPQFLLTLSGVDLDWNALGKELEPDPLHNGVEEVIPR
jgi:hypothetical protein